MDKQAVIDKIQCYTYYKARLEEAKKRLESICIKTTATYGNLAPSSGGAVSKPVENVGNRRHEIKQTIAIYNREVVRIYCMIEKSGLDEREKGVMWWIAKNGRLAAYARRERIGKDNVYKIRDRAVKKIIAAITPQNVR